MPSKGVKHRQTKRKQRRNQSRWLRHGGEPIRLDELKGLKHEN